jgi:hypothetical protein
MKTRPEGAKWINDSWEGEVLEQTWWANEEGWMGHDEQWEEGDGRWRDFFVERWLHFFTLISFTRNQHSPPKIWSITNLLACSQGSPATTLGLGEAPLSHDPHAAGHRPLRGHWLSAGWFHSVLWSSISLPAPCCPPTTGLDLEVSCQPEEREGLQVRGHGDIAGRSDSKAWNCYLKAWQAFCFQEPHTLKMYWKLSRVLFVWVISINIYHTPDQNCDWFF